MDDATWQVPAMLLAVIVAVTLVAFGISFLRGGKKSRGAWMIVGGVLLVAIPLGGTAAWHSYQESRSWEPTVSVQGLDPTGDPEFSVDLHHHLAASPGTFTYTFRDAGDKDEVLAAFQSQHPEGVDAASGPYWEGDYASVWHVYLEGARFDLFDTDNSSFTVATQVAWLSPSDGGVQVYFPFPTGSSPSSLDGITTLLTAITSEQWHEFYDPIPGVVFAGDTVTVPTSAGGTAVLTFVDTDDGPGITITLND
ncbi:hypothetical protein [Demequina sp.]|uniref:hypothetical protein n=1 Tax=Demequina sp. TaxID=2050685 RepID=UPI003D10D0CF